MQGGHVGKILRLDMTKRKADTIPTSKYEEWVGGFAMGLALFYDEVDHDYITDTKDITGFEPENVLCIMSGPLQGTAAPSGGRCEVVGMSPEAYPRAQFTRSNFGGRFSAMMKFAGYDGIVIKGAADAPVWVNIINDKVVFEDAHSLWGLDTYETQEEIWREVGGGDYTDSLYLGTARDSGSTTQRPAVVTMGPIGEKLGRIASLIHEAGHGAGQGGFGGVFGSKKLKAISVLGSGSVPLADPKELFAARQWYASWSSSATPGLLTGGIPGGLDYQNWGKDNYGRAGSCFGCDRGCFMASTDGASAGGQVLGAGNQCVDTYLFRPQDIALNGKVTEDSVVPTTYVQRWGINAFNLGTAGVRWLKSLYDRGLLGKGKMIETDLDFEKFGTEEFNMEFLRKIAYREPGLGDDMAEGNVRAAAKWGILEQELMNGELPHIYWLGESHWGVWTSWAFESIFQVRDINNHVLGTILQGGKQGVPARIPPEVRAKRLAEIAPPWHDELMADRSEEGIYSIHMARCVAWDLRYNHYLNTAMMCDFNNLKWFDAKGNAGMSPEFETRFLNAVTGLNYSWEDALELGRRIWNFERAVLALHGRHRDEEYFPPFPPYDSYVYSEGEPYLQNHAYGGTEEVLSETYSVFKDGKWADEVANFPLDKAKMDEFKTIYYELEGWDTATGLPTRKTLEDLDLKFVADELAARGKLPG